MNSGFGYVYLLIKDDEIIYIGATRRANSRIRSHYNKDFDFYVLIFNPNYRKLEMDLIAEYRPKLNKQCNPDFDTRVYGRPRIIKVKPSIKISALRIPRPVHESLREEAKKQMRSLNNEIIFRLEESLKDEPQT